MPIYSWYKVIINYDNISMNARGHVCMNNSTSIPVIMSIVQFFLLRI